MVIILERPNYPPYVCIVCSHSTGRRWFVSLDLPLDHYFNPVNDGNVFYCNECWEDLATRVAKDAQTFLLGHEPWFGDEYVKPVYENETELVEEVAFGTGTSNSSITEYSITTTGSEPEPKPNDPELEPTTTDAETEPVSEFRVFFGGTGDTGGV